MAAGKCTEGRSVSGSVAAPNTSSLSPSAPDTRCSTMAAPSDRHSSTKRPATWAARTVRSSSSASSPPGSNAPSGTTCCAASSATTRTSRGHTCTIRPQPDWPPVAARFPAATVGDEVAKSSLVGASTSLSSRTRVAEALLMSRKAWYASSGAPGVRTAVSPVQPLMGTGGVASRGTMPRRSTARPPRRPLPTAATARGGPRSTSPAALSAGASSGFGARRAGGGTACSARTGPRPASASSTFRLYRGAALAASPGASAVPKSACSSSTSLSDPASSVRLLLAGGSSVPSPCCPPVASASSP
mmetsp:Transcript_20934/g.63009  ORF Transcript_20934/g.63009 Transcript_20934/m.63009 type:complete len:302 (+) Transcript_20934:1268-2173(+)